MTTLNNILSNTRRLALGALLGSSLALVGCGGGGMHKEQEEEIVEEGVVVTPLPETQFTVASTADLDGIVFGDNLSVQGRPDLQPGVGDFSYNGNVNSGAPRATSYYSFDLSALPEGARVKSAMLSLYSRDTLGDPQEMMVLVRVDHVNYGNVFPTTHGGAQGLDFNFATLADMNVLGRKDLDVKDQLQADLDAGRSTSQYRLRGAIASDLDNETDIALLTDGEDSFGTGELPLLIIEIE